MNQENLVEVRVCDRKLQLYYDDGTMIEIKDSNQIAKLIDFRRYSGNPGDGYLLRYIDISGKQHNVYIEDISAFHDLMAGVADVV
jgi:hypothetical protein